MRPRPLAVFVLLLTLVTSAAMGATKPVCLFELLDRPGLPTFETKEPALIERLKGVDPKIAAFRIEITPEQDPDFKNYDLKVVMESGRTKTIGSGSITNAGGSFHLLVEVDPNYRDKGINRAVFDWVLKQNPSIEHAPLGLADLNQTAFVAALATETEGQAHRDRVAHSERDKRYKIQLFEIVRDEFLAAKSKPQVQRLKKRIAAAFFKTTPAGRLRWDAGFRRLRSLELMILSDGKEAIIELHVDKGEPDEALPFEVKIVDKRSTPPKTVRWLPDGKVQ